MNPASLLSGATRILDQSPDELATIVPRVASVLVRMALERGVGESLSRLHDGADRAPFAAQFQCLVPLIGLQLASQASVSWDQMSRVAHYSDGALPPASGEVRQWAGVVERVLAALPPRTCAHFLDGNQQGLRSSKG